MMIIRGVNVFPTQVEEILLTTSGLAPHFQCVLTRPRRLDELTVRVEALADVPLDQRAGLAAQVAARAKDTIGVTARVEVVDPDTIERSVGKMKRILDLR
jgi:phenylacetate-CoA ligase